MKTIQSASWDLNVELFEDELNRQSLVALPASSLSILSESFEKTSVNRMKHWLLELNWTRAKVKWGGADHSRVIFLRPGYTMHNGTLYGPGGWSHTPSAKSGFADYARKGLLKRSED
jgi:hypothetical protein